MRKRVVATQPTARGLFVEGAARHCKMLNTPKAWEVFNELVTGYFELKANVKEPPPVVKTIHAVDRLLALADKVKDDDARDKLYLQAAALINR